MVSIGLRFYWSCILRVLIEIKKLKKKKKNNVLIKSTIKCSKYNVTLILIDEL